MYAKIKSEIIEAMKNGDTVKRDCLKNVVGKAQVIMKEKHTTMDSESIPDAVMLDALQKEAKQLNQTIEALEGREDTDLYKVSGIQIEILKGYLPKQMNKKEVEEAVAWILSQGEYNSFSEKIKVCMKELKGEADNKLIKEVVEAYSY